MEYKNTDNKCPECNNITESYGWECAFSEGKILDDENEKS